MNTQHDPNATADLAEGREGSRDTDALRAGNPRSTIDHAPDSARTDDRCRGVDATAGDVPAVPGYRVLREIARGGMGRFLAAYDLGLDRDVALKVLLPGANADRFVRESKITARLPYVVTGSHDETARLRWYRVALTRLVAQGRTPRRPTL
ncbi:MAG: hypothetical protein U0746_22730 [Gemmataceae bacterium]